MQHVIWRARARRRAQEIVDYVSDRNPAAAERLAELFEQAAERLPDRPYIHRPGRVPGTREALVHPNYILVYRVGGGGDRGGCCAARATTVSVI